MTTTTAVTAPPWTLGFQTLEDEHEAPVALDVEGTWPAELTGTLYRVGPAQHEVGGRRYRHWFDGDGMVHALTADGRGLAYRNRFVATDKRRDEAAAGRALGPGFGTRPNGSALQRLRHLRPANAANTNVVHHGGRLLALWEQGHPWALDPTTLATLGEDDLDGCLGPTDTYSAHPRVHPTTGDLWNFGVRYGPTTTLTLVRTTVDGRSTVVTRRRLPWPAMVHDFVVTATRAVVLVPPFTLARLPLGLMTGATSYSDALHWRPRLGTRALVYDLASDAWVDHRLDPLSFFHLVDAVDDGDTVVLDVCAGRDGALFDAVAGYLQGRAGETGTTMERITLAPGATPRRATSSPTTFDFPRLAPRGARDAYRHVYGVGRHPDGGFFGAPVRVDADTGAADAYPVGPHEFAGECVPVPKSGARRDDEVWLLTLVLDAMGRRTQLWVLDGEVPGTGPVATATLPHVVPFGFHGCWVPSGG